MTLMTEEKLESGKSKPVNAASSPATEKRRRGRKTTTSGQATDTPAAKSKAAAKPATSASPAVDTSVSGKKPRGSKSTARKPAAAKSTRAAKPSRPAAKKTGRKTGAAEVETAPDAGLGTGGSPQDFFIEALSDLPVGVAAFDANNILVFANHQFYEVFGSPMNEAKPGHSIEDLVAFGVNEQLFEDIRNPAAVLDAVARLKPGESHESTLQLSAGRRIGQRIKKLANGGWISVLSDLTELMRAEQKAREAEYRWSFALESAQQGVWDANLMTGEMFYSPMWRVLRGLEDLPDEDLNEQSWLKRLHPDDVEAAQDYVRRQSEGEVFENGFTYRERHGDGHWLWIHGRGRAVEWDDNGKPTRIIGTDTDVTEMREAQEALAEAESRWNFALKATGQGVWDADIRTKTVFYSPTWRAMRGFEPDEEIDSASEVWLERVHPDDRERLRETIKSQDRGEIPFNHFEYRERHRDGHYIWIQSRGKPVAWDEDGRPTRTIGVDADITAQKELELRAAESLRQLNTTLDNFPGGICMYDKDLVLTVANARYYQINHIDQEQFPLGTNIEDIIRFSCRTGALRSGRCRRLCCRKTGHRSGEQAG